LPHTATTPPLLLSDEPPLLLLSLVVVVESLPPVSVLLSTTPLESLPLSVVAVHPSTQVVSAVDASVIVAVVVGPPELESAPPDDVSDPVVASPPEHAATVSNIDATTNADLIAR
jgi:hypothetical protein